MIKLLDILREAVMPQNKMIIMAGGAGAGKSTLINKIKSVLAPESNSNTLGSDEEIINVLKDLQSRNKNNELITDLNRNIEDLRMKTFIRIGNK